MRHKSKKAMERGKTEVHITKQIRKGYILYESKGKTMEKVKRSGDVRCYGGKVRSLKWSPSLEGNIGTLTPSAVSHFASQMP